MVVISNLLYVALLAVPALASPAPKTTPAPKTLTAYKCKNGGTVTMATINNSLSSAPIVEGKSSYPHAFQNYQKFPMSDRCNNKVLLELPIFTNGKPYNVNSNPKDEPGPMRAIFSNPGKLLCNVIAHVGPGNAGNFEQCTPIYS